MFSGEVTDASGMGITAILSAALIVLMVTGCVHAKGWYVTRDEYEVRKVEVQQSADTYKFEMVAEVTGDDIVEFMLKYGLNYNYKIYTSHRKNGVVFSLAQIKKTVQKTNKYPDLETAVLDVFSEDYLSSIFGNDIYGDYKVYTVKAPDNVTSLGYVCVQYTAGGQLICEEKVIDNEITETLQQEFAENLVSVN